MAMNETLSLLARLNTDLGHGWGLQGGSHLQQPQVAATAAAATDARWSPLCSLRSLASSYV